MNALSWFVGGVVFFLAACSSNNPPDATLNNNSADEPVQQATSANIHHLDMANPASVNCTNVGGVLTIAKQLNGGSVGMCQLPDGKRCEEWALMRGTCPAR